ncbi:MAG: thioesterase [Alphaproteobacteria bacterium]|nr:thioesterase [Alphaproteobacteria bacterium]
MNLLFRLVWMMVTARRRSRCVMMEETHLSFRVMPTDLDVNMHLTNSRYFSFMDLSRVDHMIRNGAWKHIRANKLMPVFGSGPTRFRRAAPPFKRLDITTRVVGVDDKWIYLEHKIISGETVYSVSILKAAFVDDAGRVPVDRLLTMFGYEGDLPPMTEALTLIRDADNAVMEISAA